ncbi:PhoPQ-regulated protein, partial [Salmonella enterica]|nr:PhoPQ-regulated protein [Salmonella enterica]
MKKIYLVIILVLFISTNVYTQLHNNIFFCRNSPECDLSHVLPDYREHISDTPLKYTLISTEPLAQVELRHYELLSQHWSPDDMVTPAQWRHNVDIYIPETAKQRHALVVVNNGVNYEEGVQINSKPVDFTQETLASIARDTNTIVISVSDIPNQYLTFQDDKKPLKEDESVSRSWALFMEAPEQRKLMPLNIPMVSSLSQAIRLAKEELTR